MPIRLLRAATVALVAFVYIVGAVSAQSNHAVLVGHIDGIINPATANYVDRVITDAERSSALAVVFSVDSPGGLADPTRQIDQRIERSNVPVLVYVASNSEHIAYAANQVGLTPALDQQAITGSYQVANVSDLLQQANGSSIQVAAGPITLDTANAPTRPADMTAVESFVHTLTNPTIAYILLSMGSLGLILELLHPGSVFPGVVGGICLLLAFYALGSLPLNLAGVALVGFGLLLFGLEPFLTAHGVLALGGGVAFVFGSLLLINAPDAPYLRVSPVAIGAVTTVLAGFFVLLVGFVLRARRSRAVTGHEGLVGATGVVRRDIEPGRQGLVQVLGELWRATAADGRLLEGQPIVVQSVDGLVLVVRRASGSRAAPPRPAAPVTAKSKAAGR
ncbi:MAG: nodulation protein NfeD [Chloroflexi bacterium]|nr:nodulation protein NfeD [Chloroflexota bacterium]